MQGLAAILFPLVLMLIALSMESLDKIAMRGSGAVSPDQVDSLLRVGRPAAAETDPVAEVTVLPTTVASAPNNARRAS
ncbi:hypothetical protein GCM10010528_25590 [Gordonia defluvii]|jgi:hypothetical protein|uniref:Secreted protein n=1 Tax=Gordonia defluvii TaxID=283718 RepID=A0ABP6LJV6_9ACTN|nr:hypothetical protein [Gordonia sp. UBA5067]